MRGLLTDFGGVLTTNVFDSFKAFSVAEGLPPDTVKRTFREDAEALALLRRLERGELSADEFSPLFGARLGVTATDGLVDRLFAGVGPDERMIDAVRSAHSAGIRTALISNSWGDHGISYDRDLLSELFDKGVPQLAEAAHWITQQPAPTA